MFKRVLTKTDFAKLSDEHKALYKEADDGTYKIQIEVEGAEETEQALAKTKANNEKLTAELKALKDTQKSEKERLEEASRLDLAKNGKLEELETSYKKKLADQTAEFAAKEQGLRDRIAKTVLDAEVAKLTGDLFVSNRLGEPLVRGRLAVEFDDAGDARIRVLDAAGKASASTLDDFRKELSTDKELSSILKGSKAAGGGRDGAGGKGPSSSDEKPKSLWDADADSVVGSHRAKQESSSAQE